MEWYIQCNSRDNIGYIYMSACQTMCYESYQEHIRRPKVDLDDCVLVGGIYVNVITHSEVKSTYLMNYNCVKILQT